VPKNLPPLSRFIRTFSSGSNLQTQDAGQLLNLPDVGRTLVGFQMSEDFPHNLQVTVHGQIQDNLNFLKMETTSFFFKWKTTSMFWSMEEIKINFVT
jgi:hypothetical protein